jgi:hypothetical protein
VVQLLLDTSGVGSGTRVNGSGGGGRLYYGKLYYCRPGMGLLVREGHGGSGNLEDVNWKGSRHFTKMYRRYRWGEEERMGLLWYSAAIFAMCALVGRYSSDGSVKAWAWRCTPPICVGGFGGWFS